MSFSFVETARELYVTYGDNALVIDRASAQIVPTSPEKLPAGVRPQRIAGVLGVLDLPLSKYLVLATSSEQAGSLGGAPVWKVKSTTLVPFHESGGRDREYLALVRSHLAQATLYYSPSYDLTSSSQRTAKLASNGAKSTIDERFFWNYEISRDLYTSFPGSVLPVIYGVFSAASLTLNGQPVGFAVVSRRSRFRAGTRYFRRGLDSEGHAANFNETEQLLFVADRKFSFLQTRGSVPAFWSEINDLKYKPRLRIGDLDASVAAARKHFKEQEEHYGEQYLVNLVNQSGYEKPVKEVYEAVVKQLADPKLHYVYFDFHHECSKMRWHRVQILVDQLVQLGLDKAQWFEARGGAPVRAQQAVVRTNCMDCLDRTNVVQSTLALYMLEHQLEAAGVLANGAKIASDPVFVAKFRNIWADNADGVSTAYSGTGALKTDFTRTGQRTKAGALEDLRNSIVRYYKNNLRDGPRQDGFSLFLGEYVPSSRENPFEERNSVWLQSVPYILGGCGLVAVLSVLYPSERHSLTFNIIVTLAFSAAAVASLRFIFAHGLQYVNWPRLSSVRFVQWTPRHGYQIAGEGSSSKDD